MEMSMGKFINYLKNLFNKEADEPIDIYATSKVFRTSGVPEHTFISRDILTEEIDECLDTKDGVLLFLGYSKSGKTVFRKKHIDENENFNTMTFRGNKNSTIDSLYSKIAEEFKLSQPIETEESNRQAHKQDNEQQIGNKNIGHVKEGEAKEEENSRGLKRKLFSSALDVNFLCDELKDKNALIVIEDYHLINNEFNQLLSEDLKHFLDEEILFLLIGIPSTPRRTLKNNPDLSGRMKHISFDYLTIEEIKELISKGGNLLNIEFDEAVVNEIIKVSFKNAYLVQFICKTILHNYNIKKTSLEKIKFTKIKDVNDACVEIAKTLDHDYSAIYNVVAAGGRTRDEAQAIDPYIEILHCIKDNDIRTLESGLNYKVISNATWQKITETKVKELIENKTYKSEKSFKSSINAKIKNAVNNINDNLEKGSTKPILYVDNDILYLTDLIFKFYINWKTDSV